MRMICQILSATALMAIASTAGAQTSGVSLDGKVSGGYVSSSLGGVTSSPHGTTDTVYLKTATPSAGASVVGVAPNATDAATDTAARQDTSSGLVTGGLITTRERSSKTSEAGVLAKGSASGALRRD